MPSPAILKQSDLTRYAKALRAAGVEQWRIDIEPTGKVSIIAGQDSKNPSDVNDWD